MGTPYLPRVAKMPSKPWASSTGTTLRGHFKHVELFFCMTILPFSKSLPMTFPSPRGMFWSYGDPLSLTGDRDAPQTPISHAEGTTPRGHFKHFELFFCRTILPVSKSLPMSFPSPRGIFWSYGDPLSPTG
jgi:hypothetical protein